MKSPLEQVSKQIQVLDKNGFQGLYVYISSGAVYGNTPITGAKEDSELLPLSIYARGKVLVERYLEELASETLPFSILILRVFSAYSERLDARVLAKIAGSWKFNSQLNLAGTGGEIRDFVHTQDLASVIYQILNLPQIPGFQVLNVGTGLPITLEKVVSISREAFQLEPQSAAVFFDGSHRQSDPKIMVADTQRLKTIGLPKMISPEVGLSRYFVAAASG